MAEVVRLHPGQYRDSVALMRLSAELNSTPEAEAALVAMATDLNLQLAGDLGFDLPSGASPTDLLVAVRSANAAAASALADSALELLERASVEAQPVEGPVARSVRSASSILERPSVALVSVPGPHAFTEAMEALAAGLHVVVFSDNVSVEQEVALKAEAARRGTLLMGPDCGTVILSGVGVGFANVVSPGPVALVAASGTGAQQVCALLDAAEIGVEHVIGVGGRDLSAPVGGASTVRALELLAAEPAVEVVGLVAKSIDGGVRAQIESVVSEFAAPVVVIAADEPDDDLTAGACRLATALGRALPDPQVWHGLLGRGGGGFVRGLYSGGTLCGEAVSIISVGGTVVETNLARPLDSEPVGHSLVDYGADEFTAGRAHPMIDQQFRIARLEAEAADPGVAAILIDVVLGHAAHPDPAAELAMPIKAAIEKHGVSVVVALIGTRDDPQGLTRQAETLVEAGAHVHQSNAAAARHALAFADGTAQ